MSRFFTHFAVPLFVVLLLVVSAGLVLSSGVLVKLDHDVQAAYAGVRWVLPAQVYAAPLEIYPGDTLSATELGHELDRLGYRAQSELTGPGTYVVTATGVNVQTRDFAFWDANQASQRVVVTAQGDSLTTIKQADGGQDIPLLRFDPMLIGSIYPARGGEDRVMVKLSDIPPMVPKTLLLVEDRDFYQHHGISVRGILRATFADLRAGHVVQGASTITQQLIKNLFLTDRRDFKRKVREVAMAVLLERHVSKDQILEAYLNEVYLGQDGPRAVHGFGLASKFYFNKPLSELQPHEVAMLVAIVKGPSQYNPRRAPKLVLDRRNVVLQMMADEKLITREQAKFEVAQPLGLSGSTGGAERYPAFVDLVKQQLQGLYNEEDLTREGLRVFTTLDPHVQEELETHLEDGVPRIEKAHHMTPNILQGAGVVTSVGQGEVLAVVGGRDARFVGFNRAVDARRPIGSLAKPFLYETALGRPTEFNLVTPLTDEPLEVPLANGEVWAPHNYDNHLHGTMPLYQALAQSYNLPTVRVGLALGVQAVDTTFQQAGYGSAPHLPSLFLGAVDMSPMDVAQIYSTLANGGFETPLLAIKAVLTQDGKPLQRFPFHIRQTLPEGPVYLVTWAMEQVLRLGTGRWASTVLPPDVTLAGKTGTTDDFRDSWFAGFGSDRVAVIWVGRDDNHPTGLEGATGALRIWAPLMRDLHTHTLDPTPPASVQEAAVDVSTGQPVTPGCPPNGPVLNVPFLQGYVPVATGSCGPVPAPGEEAPAPVPGQAPGQAPPAENGAQSNSPGPLDWLKGIFK